MRGDIRSLRDLRAEHLPLLKNIRDKTLALVPVQFPGVASDEVRLFVHYHPSYCKNKYIADPCVSISMAVA